MTHAAVFFVGVSLICTWGEPVVMFWTIRERKIVIHSLRPLSELELEAASDE